MPPAVSDGEQRALAQARRSFQHVQGVVTNVIEPHFLFDHRASDHAVSDTLLEQRKEQPLLLAVGLPAEGVGILIAVDALPDVFATVLNVTGDLAAAAIIGRQSAPARNSTVPQSHLAGDTADLR